MHAFISCMIINNEGLSLPLWYQVPASLVGTYYLVVPWSSEILHTGIWSPHHGFIMASVRRYNRYQVPGTWYTGTPTSQVKTSGPGTSTSYQVPWYHHQRHHGQFTRLVNRYRTGIPKDDTKDTPVGVVAHMSVHCFWLKILLDDTLTDYCRPVFHSSLSFLTC